MVGVKWSEIRKKWLMVAMGTELNIEISNWKRQQIKHHQVFIWDETFFFHLRSNTCILQWDARLRRWTPWQVVKGAVAQQSPKMAVDRRITSSNTFIDLIELSEHFSNRVSTNNPKVRVVIKLNICGPLARSSGNRMFRYKVLSIPTQLKLWKCTKISFTSSIVLRVNNKHILSQWNDR